METKLEDRAHNFRRDFDTKFVNPIKRQPKWWREVIYVGIFYGLYTLVRNIHGSMLSISTAMEHAGDIVRLEQALHVFNEERIQHFFLQWPTFVKALNVYYGSAHFVVTIFVLLWLYFWQTERYHEWRNAFFVTTLLALVGYMVYPLAPPRFLVDYHFEDTMATIGGLWNFENGAVAKASNQYAAMPSLHVGWSTWCAFAILPAIKKPWLKPLPFLYPALTILTIVVTGNHYWADVAGGLLIVTLGFFIGRWIEHTYRRRFAQRQSGRSLSLDE